MPIMFMKADPIKGDVAESQHDGWINLTRVEWGAHRFIRMVKGTEGAREPGGPSFHPFHCKKLLDKASFAMEDHFDKGKAIKKVELKWLRTGDKSGLKIIRHIKLEDVLISSISQESDGGDSTPTESFTLCYTAYEAVNTFAQNDNDSTDTARTGYDISKAEPK